MQNIIMVRLSRTSDGSPDETAGHKTYEVGHDVNFCNFCISLVWVSVSWQNLQYNFFKIC